MVDCTFQNPCDKTLFFCLIVCVSVLGPDSFRTLDPVVGHVVGQRYKRTIGWSQLRETKIKRCKGLLLEIFQSICKLCDIMNKRISLKMSETGK